MPGEKNYAFWRSETPYYGKDNYRDVILWSDKSEVVDIHSRWMVLEPKELPITNRSLVEGLGDAWEQIHAVRFSAAFPVSHDGDEILVDENSRPFHVYFPTEEYSGLRFLLNADFYLEAARKDIRRCALNDYLAEELALYIAKEGVDFLKNKFPKNPAIIEILSWSQGKPDRPFAGYFYEQYLLALSQSEFVPLDSGQYKTPSEIHFPPNYVNEELFRLFFPANYLRGDENWAYPIVDVIRNEIKRSRSGLDFLYKLGTRQLTRKEIVDVLLAELPLHIRDRESFVRFLADWWNNVPYAEKKTFAEELSKCGILPIGTEWKIPSASLIFQANLRDEDTPEIPEGFDFAVVPLAVYGDDKSYNGVAAKFLEALNVVPYSARDILRRAILPKLRSLESFHEIKDKFPNSITSVYSFLKIYFDKEGATSDIQSDLRKIPVPVFSALDPEEKSWKPAGQVYFSKIWTRSDYLEFLFEGFSDVYFLGEIEEIKETISSSERDSWYRFFYWLGVDFTPRVIEEVSRYQAYSLDGHSFKNQRFWTQYKEEHQEFFKCKNVSKSHGFSRIARNNYRIDHFEDIVQLNNPEKSICLFQLLGNNWDCYRNYLSITLHCTYLTTNCPEETIPSYLSYCLRNIKWLPAEIGGNITRQLFSPQAIWNLGDDVRPDVRKMVPSLPNKLLQEKYRAIRNDLLRSDYSFDDYLALLQRLPEMFPIYHEDPERDSQKRWQEFVRAVFNWIGQTLQNILARSGEGNCPNLPDDLKVLAYRSNSPDYIAVNDPLLVYPDDPFISLDWEDALWYLKIDESWGSLRSWLCIPLLSSQVKTELLQSNKVIGETNLLKERYFETLPYFLCLVRERQYSRYDGILGRLRRLNINVVEDLSISQLFLKGSKPLKSISRDVYLQTYDTPSNRGAMVMRSGELYVSSQAAKNPYLFGDPIASYIEVERLSDAFIILFQLSSHTEKIQYLLSKGISEATINLVVDELKTQPNREESEDIQKILEKLFGNDHLQLSCPVDDITSSRPTDNTQDGTRGDETQKGAEGTEGSYGKGGRGTALRNRPRGKLRTYVESESDSEREADREDVELRKEIDQAGVRKVLDYEAEHNRSPKEMPHNNPGYDIESIDVHGNKLYIEVKSLLNLWGERNSPSMSKPQFEFAGRAGESYWLYIVECATDKDSKIHRINNPAQRVNQYLFDEGWIQLAENE